MRRPHVQPFLGLRFHPAVENAAARKHECVRAIIVDDGQFEIAVERRGGNLLPHWGMFGRTITRRIDLNHVEPGSVVAVRARARMKPSGHEGASGRHDRDVRTANLI